MIRTALSSAISFEDFSGKLLQQGVTVKESRGRLSYLTPDRTKPITARKLGDDFDRAAVLEALTQNAQNAARAAEKLRKEKQRAAGANIYFQLYPENRRLLLSSTVTSTTVAFEHPTDDTAQMMKAIRPKLRGIFVPGRRYKKSGVLFFGLESGENAPRDLFAPDSEKNNAGLFSVVDQINAKYGRGTLFTLGEGTTKSWQMKRSLLSPDYTTSWDQLLKVK